MNRQCRRTVFVFLLGLLSIAATGVFADTTLTNSMPFPTGIAFDGTYLYLSNDFEYRNINKIDPATGATVATIPLGGSPRDLVYDGAGHFFASDISGHVTEIDTAGTVINQFPLPFRGGAIAFDGTNLYIGDTDGRTILVTDRNGNQIRSFDSGLRPEGMVFDPLTGNLRVITLFDSNIYEITTTGTYVRGCGSPYAAGPFGLGGITLVGSKFYIAEPLVPGDPFAGTAILVLDRNSLVCNPPACSDSAPHILNAAASSTTLWPPDRRMVDVAISYEVKDECDTATSSLSVSSNEAVSAGGDWEIVDAHHVRLRAERSGTGNGRTYTILVTASDGSNHASTESVTVALPHDQRSH